MKKIIAIILSVLLFSSLTIPAFAQSDKETDNSNVAEEMIELIDLLFSKQARAYLKDGLDITDSFVNNYQLLYDEKDYQRIQSAFFEEEVWEIEGDVIESRNKQAEIGLKSEITMTYSQTKAALVTHTGTYYNGKKWYIISQASGTYTVGSAYPNIIVIYNVSNPTISVSFSDEGAAFTGIVDSVYTSTPVINASATSFSFYTTITHHLICPIPGFSYLTGTLGPYSNTFNYTISA